MSVRTVHALSLVAALIAIVLVATRRDTRPPDPTPAIHPLALVPPGPAFVASLEIGRLRRTSAAVLLEHADFSGWLGASDACALDPMRDLDVVVVSTATDALGQRTLPSPPPDAPTAVALIATGRFQKRTIARCATARIVARGGEPRTDELGSFTIVRDPRAAGQVAARDGLLVLSEGPYFRAILDAAEGRTLRAGEAELTRDRLHVELRRTFGGGAPLIATAIVPGGYLEQAFGAEAARSALASVRTAALRTEVRDKLVIGAFLGCVSLEGCAELETFLAETRAALDPFVSGEPGRLLAAIGMRRERERVELTLELTFSQLRAVGAALGLSE